MKSIGCVVPFHCYGRGEGVIPWVDVNQFSRCIDEAGVRVEKFLPIS